MDISAIMELFYVTVDIRIALVCCFIGVGIKYCTKIDNKYIIPINLGLGYLFALWASGFSLAFDVFLCGVCSGAFATFIYEAVVKKITENFGDG